MAQRKKEVAWMNMGQLKVKIEMVYRKLEKKKLMGVQWSWGNRHMIWKNQLEF